MAMEKRHLEILERIEANTERLDRIEALLVKVASGEPVTAVTLKGPVADKPAPRPTPKPKKK